MCDEGQKGPDSSFLFDLAVFHYLIPLSRQKGRSIRCGLSLSLTDPQKISRGP
ncbi:hypothetical protein J1C52_00920 [Roseibaca sp. Y0-43]|nr:hypothetical protein [Roseibaca sp. Y0-43]